MKDCTQCINHYSSPLGEMLLSADEQGLTGLWFETPKFFPYDFDLQHAKEKSLSVFDDTKAWLDEYFSGNEPMFTPKLHLIGTDFQKSIWDLLLEIPYSQTVTYGELAKKSAEMRGKERMSAQAIGNAVGHNNISIIVPCHRVIGKGGNLTGYAGGIDKKLRLLEIEKVDTGKFFFPKKIG